MSQRRTGRFVGAPLFVQVVVLMASTLLAALLLSLLAALSLPPATPVTYQMSDIVRAYNGLPPLDSKRRLDVVITSKPPPSTFEAPEDRGRKRFLQRYMARARRYRRPIRARWSSTRAARVGTATPSSSRCCSRPVSGRSWSRRSPSGCSNLTGAGKSSARLARLRSIPCNSGPWCGSWRWPSPSPSPPGSFARRLASPLTQFAEAAERLGRDPRAPPLDIRGSSEIVTAARAFNDMQTRLRRYVEDRTAMVGAIAHDLRTPLTRLRFRIEGAPEELRGKMSADLDEMEAMISATLSFVRDSAQAGKRTKLELSSLLESLADEMTETGKAAAIERADKVVVEGDPISLKRLFANLLENAVKYGGRARIRVFQDGPSAVVEIDDDGPGVPAAELDRVFEPFYRREPSRNRETGGIGLGLAVVRTIARAHGGDAELSNRPGGGLTARVRLPI